MPLEVIHQVEIMAKRNAAMQV